MKIEQQLLKINHRCRPRGNYRKTTITIHSTGNSKSTAKNERAWLDNPSNNRDASWHYVVGEDVIIQAIPDCEEAWHCGNREGNRYSIGIELIESGDRRKVLENGAALVAAKLQELSLPLNAVKKHADWASKNCPRILIDKAYINDGLDWWNFMSRVERLLEGEREMEKEKRIQKVAELPEWAQPTIQKLVNEGKIADENKLDLTLDMIRVLIILRR